MSKDRSLEWIEYTRVEGEITRARERILTELGLTIILNGEQYTTAMITPMMVKEFVTGYLFGQRMIEGIHDIISISITDSTAEVTLTGKRTQVTETAEVHSDFKVEKEAIFNGINTVLKSEIYAETGAIHSAGLFKANGEPVCIAEDIGRHNALDKVIGYALMNKVDLRNVFVTSTGRMVAEMVSKICHANIPVVATKAAVTRLGVELGEKCGLTIIGFVRDKGTKITSDTSERIITERLMKIYTNPERIHL